MSAHNARAENVVEGRQSAEYVAPWEGLNPPYRTLVVDPPWHYEGFASSPSSRHENPRGNGIVKATRLPYSSMSVKEIAALPVADLADPNATLFLWTTNRYLPHSFAVMRGWGFSYRQTLVWHKTGNPSPFGGSVAPIHAEFLLVGKIGRPATTRWNTSVIAAPAANCGAHSSKPPAILDIIEQITPGPYVELFARAQRLGWHSWGYGYEVAS